MKQPIIAPSVLACDFGRINEEVEMINQSNADWFHIDIMDGRFVPNISFGFPVLEAIAKKAQKPLDVHLMIEEPEKYVEYFAKAGAEIISVHVEACPHLHRNIQQIKNLGVKAGVALNPHTPVDVLSEVIQDIDLVCVMSVNPGFGGQKFIENTYMKVEKLRKMIDEAHCATQIEIDGGVNQQNAPKLMEKGADVLVAGNFVFSAENPHEKIDAIKNIKSK
jgi:ribulose-phosphate 3-epimerase